jgi:squalene synthase HpnC
VSRGAQPDAVALSRHGDALRSTTARAAERVENFTVAPRLLPGALRRDLRSVYDVARTIDDLGDEATGDRTALLDEYEHDLRRAWSAEPARPELRRLARTVRARSLSLPPFLALVAANRLDQTQPTYATWSDLRHYCTLSADPIGRIVLEVFGAATPQRCAWSDDVCTALQVLEHCQDVAEDRRRGRVYLPQDDLAGAGVAATDLEAGITAPAVRAAVSRQVDRARELLDSGRPLVRSLGGVGRWAVAGYVGGGLATVAALRRADCDVLAPAVSCRPRRRDAAGHALHLAVGR